MSLRSTLQGLLYPCFVLSDLIGTHVTSGNLSNGGFFISPFESNSMGSRDSVPINVSIKMHNTIFRDITNGNSAKSLMSTQRNNRCSLMDEKLKMSSDKVDICFHIIVILHTLIFSLAPTEKNTQYQLTYF